ncbi:MAG: AmmeMemoRadiSam system protein A [Acidobacteria bacterium]|nr:AmmeMemoRadiSam system protein A [Acidobacteriota bacterium]
MVALTAEQRKELLRLARYTLEAYVTSGVFLSYDPEDPALAVPRAAFVTLTRKTELRGCVGSISADQPLYHCVMDSAIAAATQDRRFPPVRAEELREITIHISVLSALRRISHIGEIELGCHGLVVGLGTARGILLPQVPIDYGWDVQRFAEQTCRKAGLDPSAWSQNAVMEVFTTDAFCEP